MTTGPLRGRSSGFTVQSEKVLVRFMVHGVRNAGLIGTFLVGASLHALAFDPMMPGDDRLTPSVDIAAPMIKPVEIIPVAIEIEKLFREQSTIRKFARIPKNEIQAVVAFYASRNNAPLWLTEKGWTDAASSLIDRLSRAEEDALEPRDYPVRMDNASGLAAPLLAETDISLSLAIVAYARDARGARIEPVRLSKLMTPQLDMPKAQDVLANVTGANEPGRALQAYNPQHVTYQKLKAKLSALRDVTGSIAPASAPPVPRNPIKTDTRLAQVASGPITSTEIIANMERWRWLPAALNPNRIEVNLPEFTLRLYRDNAVVHVARTIVGKKETPTPLLTAEMTHLIVNPSWYVPQSIIRNEFMPKMEEDPDFAARHGYEVVQEGDMTYMRQPPGDDNALGYVKFIFPNQHSVYLHDTSTRKLFANTERAYSHGCVRLDDPFALAGILLSDQDYTTESLKAMIGKAEKMIKLKAPLAIHLNYFTLATDADGNLTRINDVYGYDKMVAGALGIGAPKAVAALGKALK
jgi:murein L,D-transpeptidase YcbB/YkuD